MIRSLKRVAVGVIFTVSACIAAPVGVAYATDTWQNAIEIPGTAALNTIGFAFADSVSCASARSCSAGGSYDGSSGVEPFVVDEVDGTWQNAIEVPGIAALSVNGSAGVSSVSCASARSCSAVGSYTDANAYQQAFVVDKVDGVWQNAIEIPGIGTLDGGGDAYRLSVSCPSAGYCSASGVYVDVFGNQSVFVVDEVDGTWQNAIEVPTFATITNNAWLGSMSCASAGYCSVGGYYLAGSGHSQAFLVNEVDGTWQNAIDVPGTDALNAGGWASVSSVSCSSDRDCSAAGYYSDTPYHQRPFVVNEVDGIWQNAIEVPGTDTLNASGNAAVNSVSCASANNCSAGGYYVDASSHEHAFVVNEVDGTWQNAIEVPGTDTLNAGGNAAVGSMSCASAHDCSAGGYYWDSSLHENAFVVNEVDGTWQKAIEVPGTDTLNAGGNAAITSLSCASEHNCSAVGHYTDTSGQIQAFVVSSSS